MSGVNHRLFGETLRKARKESGLTIQQLADHIGVTVGFLSDVERGRRYPPEGEQIRKACDVLKADWHQVLFEHSILSREALTMRMQQTRGQQLEVAAALMRRWENLSDEDLASIASILGRE